MYFFKENRNIIYIFALLLFTIYQCDAGSDLKNSKVNLNNQTEANIREINVSEDELKQDFLELKKVTISWLKKSYLYKDRKDIDNLCNDISRYPLKYHKIPGGMLLGPNVFFNYRSGEIKIIDANDKICLHVKKNANMWCFEFTDILKNYKDLKLRMDVLVDAKKYGSPKELKEKIMEKISKSSNAYFKVTPSVSMHLVTEKAFITNYKPDKDYYKVNIYWKDNDLKTNVNDKQAQAMLSAKLNEVL